MSACRLPLSIRLAGFRSLRRVPAMPASHQCRLLWLWGVVMTKLKPGAVEALKRCSCSEPACTCKPLLLPATASIGLDWHRWAAGRRTPPPTCEQWAAACCAGRPCRAQSPGQFRPAAGGPSSLAQKGSCKHCTLPTAGVLGYVPLLEAKGGGNKAWDGQEAVELWGLHARSPHAGQGGGRARTCRRVLRVSMKRLLWNASANEQAISSVSTAHRACVFELSAANGPAEPACSHPLPQQCRRKGWLACAARHHTPTYVWLLLSAGAQELRKGAWRKGGGEHGYANPCSHNSMECFGVP